METRCSHCGAVVAEYKFGFNKGLAVVLALLVHRKPLGLLVGVEVLGRVDLAAVGRALLVDPAWAAKVRDGRVADLLPFTPEALNTLA